MVFFFFNSLFFVKLIFNVQRNTSHFPLKKKRKASKKVAYKNSLLLSSPS
uniref:Uncharacterized protein n=1 Tax=Anguilla anguilla TaxID=7936 RepID=A0A0E9QLR9_ANGAN